MAYMPFASASVTHGWSAIKLWMVMLGHIIMIVLVLIWIVLPYAPLGLPILSGSALPIVMISTTSPHTITNSATHLGIIGPGQFALSIPGFTLKIQLLTSLVNAFICDLAYDKGSALPSGPGNGTPGPLQRLP